MSSPPFPPCLDPIRCKRCSRLDGKRRPSERLPSSGGDVQLHGRLCVSYTIDPGTYRITVYGAQGGNAADCAPANCEGGRGVEASAIYRIGQTLDLRIGVGGTAPANAIAAGGGGASFVDFEIGDPGLDVLLLVGGGGGGGFHDPRFGSAGGDGKTTQTDPQNSGTAQGGGGGGGFSTNGQSYVVAGDGGDGGASLSSGGAPGQQESPGGFGGGGGGATGINESIFGGGGGGGYNGGDAGYVDFVEGEPTLVVSQGGTSLVENNPPDAAPMEGRPVSLVDLSWPLAREATVRDLAMVRSL